MYYALRYPFSQLTLPQQYQPSVLVQTLTPTLCLTTTQSTSSVRKAIGNYHMAQSFIRVFSRRTWKLQKVVILHEPCPQTHHEYWWCLPGLWAVFASSAVTSKDNTSASKVPSVLGNPSGGGDVGGEGGDTVKWSSRSFREMLCLVEFSSEQTFLKHRFLLVCTTYAPYWPLLLSGYEFFFCDNIEKRHWVKTVMAPIPVMACGFSCGGCPRTAARGWWLSSRSFPVCGWVTAWFCCKEFV